ncbi:MAG: EAL and HDOD domain-containing protein [Acidobacteriaceae bacterium]
MAQEMPARFFARQPILDRQKQVFGYEFLFRSGTQNQCRTASPSESDSATRLMVDNSVLYDFESLSGRGKTFLNCTRESLISGVVTLLPARSTVLEILEDIEPDDEVVEACRKLRKLGYQFSLDDFVPRPGLERLLPYADYIKIDFRLSDPSQRADIRRFLKGCDGRLIAEKVEEQAEFQAAVDEGFDLFQGYFFCRPGVLTRNHIPPNPLTYIQILAAVSQPSFNWRAIEQLVRRETSLCYRLLRLVNSANYGLRHEISSIERALIVVGEEHFRKLVMVAITGESGEGHSSELIRQTLQRASFCEMAAAHLHEDPTEQYLFGLLSLLPVLLGLPMQQVVDMLPLRGPVKAALLGESNDVGRSLNCLQKYQLGEWECHGCNGAALCSDQMHKLYRASLLWAEECTASETC